jgi:plasmid stabilization system protein ParE
MIHKLIVRAEARADILEAHRWYEDRSEGLGLEFARATDTCFDLISRNPNIYPKLYEEVHRALLNGFPFAVFFRVRRNTISIIACTHVRRSPERWKNRV